MKFHATFYRICQKWWPLIWHMDEFEKFTQTIFEIWKRYEIWCWWTMTSNYWKKNRYRVRCECCIWDEIIWHRWMARCVIMTICRCYSWMRTVWQRWTMSCRKNQWILNRWLRITINCDRCHKSWSNSPRWTPCIYRIMKFVALTVF